MSTKSAALKKTPAKKTPAPSLAVAHVETAAKKPVKKRKLLLISHNHPDYTTGGAEIFAYDFFKALREHTSYSPFFLAGVTGDMRQMHGGTSFLNLPGRDDEMLFWGEFFNYFLQSQNNLTFINTEFADFLREMQPDVIHFQHVFRIGLEAIQVARKLLPNTKILFTIHEYIMICHREGQMVRTINNNELCSEASPARCHQCFPNITPQDFKIRESFIKSHLELVDQFISPSHFLKDRFVKWGIPEEKITVIENGRHIDPPSPFRTIRKGEKRNVFGYFGQINPYKGVMLAIDAVKQLVKSGYTDFRLELFGNVEQQSEEFKTMFFETLAEYKDHIFFHGRYKNEDVARLIKVVDWVIIPSTWWENSPLVIQEVFMHKRPIIASDIGGMAEKVENEKTGLHFKVRSDASLAETMRRAAETPGLWEDLVSNIGPRLSLKECALTHEALYENLIKA